MPLTDGYTFPRQYNTFYYLSGIETPGAYLLFDGRTRKVTLYLPPRNERLERAEGKVLSADDAELVKRLTGVDEVLPLDAMDRRDWPLIAGPRSPGLSPGTRSSMRSSARPKRPARAGASWWRAETARALDYWDGAQLAAAALRRAAARAASARGGQGSQPDPRRAARHQEPA